MSQSKPVTCPHGRHIGGSQIPKGGWSSGVGTCCCCAQTFGFLHSSTSNWDDGVVHSSTQDQTRCLPCGGKIIQYVHPDYEYVPEECSFKKRSRPK